MQEGTTQAERENQVFSWLASIPSVGKWESLSENDRTMLLVYELDAQVCNGSFHQFFFNPSGNRWRETQSALTKMRATRIGQLFEKALTIFPGSLPSVDHLTRARQLCEIDKNAENLLQELTGKYYDLY